MQEAIRKSEVLIEALPYIKKFYGKVVVIKYGGSSIHREAERDKVLQDIIFMKYAGMKPILVHGGGPNISQKLKESNIVTQFIDGLRVTCERTMGIVDSVLTGINRDLVSEINQLGGEAFGLSGKENNLIQTRPKDGSNGLGYVGTINAVDTTIISRLIDTNLIPVVSPVGKGEDDKLYNVNADEAAYSVASALRAEKIVFMTDVMGVMADKDNADSLYHSLTADNVKKLIKDGVITGGMLPKVNACLKAIEGGVQKAHIVLAGLPHALLLEIFTDKGIGTEIVGSK